MALKFETPPESTTGRNSTKWRSILAELRANPGQWAVVAESASTTTAASIRSGRYGGASRGEFEATARVNPDGTYRVYARYPEQ